MHVLAEHAVKSESPCDIVQCRKSIQGNLLSLLSQTETCQDKQAHNQLEKQLNSAQSLFISLQKRKPLAEIKVNSNALANKNIQPQLRFFTTQIKRKRLSNVRYSKPSREEMKTIFKKVKQVDCFLNGNMCA